MRAPGLASLFADPEGRHNLRAGKDGGCDVVGEVVVSETGTFSAASENGCPHP